MADEVPAFAWPYRADLPQRFSGNFARYRARGGTADPGHDVRGFVADGDMGDIARFLAFTLAFDQIAKEDVAGDVAELGVYRGHTAHALALFARRLGRQTYLFDTFAGFDAADFSGVDVGVAPGFEDTSLAAVRAFVGEEATHFCAGHFPGTAAMVPPATSFALVHLDCDLYAPMAAALAFFYPRMAPGGFMLIHDYSSLAWEGAERAADAFFADKPECLVPMPDGCGTAIVRRARPAGGPNWQERRLARVFSDAGMPTADPAADAALTEGWSGAEPWGRWGVGDAHTLRLALPGDWTGGVVLELDAEAVILGTQTAQTVDAWVGETLVGRLMFSGADNRGVRTLKLPAASGSVGVTFRPHACPSPAMLQPGHADHRPLGMALHWVRVRPG